MTNFSFKAVTAASILLLGAALSARGQALPGSAEVSVGGGLASYHASGSDGVNKGKAIASIAYNFSHNAAVGFEYGYSKLADINETDSVGGATVSEVGTSKLSTFGGFIRGGFLKKPSKVNPYLSLSFGGLSEKDSYTATSKVGSISSTDSESSSASGGYFGFGIGANIMAGRLGFRPELHLQNLYIQGTTTADIDFTGSLFYTFGGRKQTK